MSKQHAPTPWRLVIPEGYGKSTLIMYGTDIIAEMVGFENKTTNAKFILKAVNNHDRLVKALDVLASLVKNDPIYQDDINSAIELLTELKS